MNDGSHIVFINEEHSRKRSEEKELLHDHKCTEPEDMILFSRSKAPVRTESAGECLIRPAGKTMPGSFIDRVPAGIGKAETQMLQKIRNVEIVASENREGLYA